MLSDLFSVSREDEDDPTFANDQIPAILSAVLSSPPNKADTTLSPAWVLVLGNAVRTYNIVDPTACAAELGKVWKTVWTFLESPDSPTRVAAVESLDLLSQCISPALISAALTAGGEKSTLGKIITQTSKSLDSLSFARFIPAVLSVISSLIRNVLGGEVRAPGVEGLVLPLVKQVGDLRAQNGFEFKEDADATLGVAMGALGPEVLLGIMPLNLEPGDR